MIAPIKSQQVVTSSSQAAAPSFESFLPILKIQFKKACRLLPSWHDKNDAQAEMVAIAFTCYASLVRRGRTDIYSTPLGDYAVKSYFSGRLVTGTLSQDITSPRCQILGRAVVTNNRICDAFACRKTPNPSTIACFNIDFEAWTQSLDGRTRDILFAMIDGYCTSELAKKFSCTPGRISQIRRELVDSWKEFTADCSQEES